MRVLFPSCFLFLKGSQIWPILTALWPIGSNCSGLEASHSVILQMLYLVCIFIGLKFVVYCVSHGAFSRVGVVLRLRFEHPQSPLLLFAPLLELPFLTIRFFFAALVALGFHALLRTGELMNLCFKDLEISETCGVVTLRNTKMGQRTGACEAVAVRDRLCLQLLLTVQCLTDFSPGTPIWPHSAQKIRDLFPHYQFFSTLILCSLSHIRFAEEVQLFCFKLASPSKPS